MLKTAYALTQLVLRKKNEAVLFKKAQSIIKLAGRRKAGALQLVDRPQDTMDFYPYV